MEEAAHLKKEIDRQNQIIAILIDQIGILKSQNTYYLNVIRVNNLGNTIAEIGNVSSDTGNTIAEIGNAYPDIGSTIAEKGNAYTDIGNTIAEKGNTSPNVENTIAEKENVSPNIGNTIAEKGNTSPNIGNTIAEKGNASSNEGNTIAGNINAAVQINMASEEKLARVLLKYYPVSIKRMALESIARQLLLLNNTGRTSRKELRKISRLSAPGFAKAIPKLVRRGLVKKVSYQEYELSAMSKEIIAKVFAV